MVVVVVAPKRLSIGLLRFRDVLSGFIVSLSAVVLRFVSCDVLSSSLAFFKVKAHAEAVLKKLEELQ